MAAATISPSRPAASATGHWGPDQMTVTGTPNHTEGESRFRIAREKKGLTQQQCADYCGASLKSIKRYDAGRHPQRMATAQRLAEVLGKPPEWLWPPEDDLNVRVARANYPTPPLADPLSAPDPHEVLATLHPTRPGVRRHARWLAPAIALAALAATAAVVLATTGHNPPAPPTNAGTSSEIAPVPTGAPPPLLAARTANAHRASKRPSKQRSSHHPSKRRRTSASRKRVAHPSRPSTPVSSARAAQPPSTTQQPTATTATASAATPASSTPAKRQPAGTPSSGGGEFLP